MEKNDHKEQCDHLKHLIDENECMLLSEKIIDCVDNFLHDPIRKENLTTKFIFTILISHTFSMYYFLDDIRENSSDENFRDWLYGFKYAIHHFMSVNFHEVNMDDLPDIPPKQSYCDHNDCKVQHYPHRHIDEHTIKFNVEDEEMK